MEILEYVKLFGKKYMAWATKKDVEDAVKDIDTSKLAKQGENESATNTEIDSKLSALSTKVGDLQVYFDYKATDDEAEQYFNS